MPGSPPSRIIEPRISPPPSTRFTSVLERSNRLCSLCSISRTRWGFDRGLLPVRAVTGEAFSRAITSSVKEFHAPHDGQCPSHFGASNPHSLQKYAFLILAMSFQLSVKDSDSRGIVPPKAKFFLSPVRFRAVAWRLVRGGPTDRLPVRAPDCTRSVSEAGCVRYPGCVLHGSSANRAYLRARPSGSQSAMLRRLAESPAPGYLMKNR